MLEKCILMNKKITLFIARGCGSGRIPYAPGTWGSLVALPLCVFILSPLSLSHAYLYLATLVTLIFLSVWIADQAEKFLQKKDASEIVIDEVVGLCVALAFVPLSWQNYVAGFLLFRLFDIIKPFPGRWAQDHLKGGWGIVLDDVVAGLYACLLIQIYLFVSSPS